MNRSIEFLKTLNISTDYIIVGCSSGPDSMCLLNLLYENGYNVVCAHVNHNIREESKEEFQYIKNFCEQKNIQFEGIELDKSSGGNEYYYRKKRYSFYKKLADKYNTKYIATAHHADDLMETILMRISRGSNLKGYLGFSKIFNEKGYLMIKPLIFYTKADILEYLNNKKIKYYIDATNDTDNYTRNRYRHNVIPFLKKEDPSIHNKYLQFSSELEKANSYINSVVLNEMKKNYNNNTVDLDRFLFLDEYIKECELEKIFSIIFGDDIDLFSKKTAKNILDRLKTNKNFVISLPKGFQACREYNKLVIRKKIKNENYLVELSNRTEIGNEHVFNIVSEDNDTSNFCIRLNTKDISLPLYIRNRKQGDRINVKNMAGSQKVKQVMIDSKIEPSKRDNYPIVVDSQDTILWIPGIKKSKFDNDINKKYDIILKYMRKEEDYEKFDEEEK